MWLKPGVPQPAPVFGVEPPFSHSQEKACIYFILVVGAARFELTTPCAQGSFRHYAESACFQVLMFQADAGDLLRIVEL